MEELLGDMVIFNRCKYHNGIVGNHRLKMLVSNDSFSFCYNLIMELIKNEKKYLQCWRITMAGFL